jgi:mitochondrial fission protein ELM1
MSEVDTTTNSKKRVCAEDTDNEVEVVRVVQATTKPKAKSKRLNAVYLVLACGVPLHNYKWGEHAGYETQDTQIVGVFANIKEANRAARLEAFDEESDDADDEDEVDVGGDEALFHWEEEEPSEWTARRV